MGMSSTSSDLDKVIHKINSFIAVIYGYSQLIQENPSNSELVAKWNQKILDVSKQLQEYINSMDKKS
jgi:hypothetical protein